MERGRLIVGNAESIGNPTRPHPRTTPLRATDAFFVHAADPCATPQLGAILVLSDEARAVPLEELADHVRTLVSRRAPELPMLSRRLDPRPGRWPRWVHEAEVSGPAQVRVRSVGGDMAWESSAQEFFDSGLPTDRPPWKLGLMRDSDTGRTAVLVAVHHALGDGVALTDTLIRLLADDPPPRPTPPRARPRPSPRDRTVRAVLVLRGLLSLAGAILPPPEGVAGAATTARHYAMAQLPSSKVRSVARERGVSSSALLIAVVAEGLHQFLDGRGGTAVGQRLRAMVPQSTRPVRSGADGGNWTAAMSLDLPVGPMPPARRLAQVATALAELGRGGQPTATDALMAAQRFLPARLHARLVRLISRRRFFNLNVSVLPGSRRAHRMAGVQVSTVFPVLSLGATGLAVGLINWGDTIGIGVTADVAALPDADELAVCLSLALDDIAADPPEPSEVI